MLKAFRIYTSRTTTSKLSVKLFVDSFNLILPLFFTVAKDDTRVVTEVFVRDNILKISPPLFPN